MAASKEEIMLAMNSKVLSLPGYCFPKGIILDFIMGNDIFVVLPTAFRKGAHNTET